MIILTATTDNLQLVLEGAVSINQCQIMTSWRDITTSLYTPGRTLTLSNNSTDVNIVPSPASSTQRVVDFISVFNRDSANHTVTIKLDANGTEYILCQYLIGTGERLDFVEGAGFTVYTAQGAAKTSLNQGSSPVINTINSVVLTADVINNNAVANTIQDVTGLSFPVASGSNYFFEFYIQYEVDATTTGSRWAINGPGGTMRYMSEYSLTATTTTTNESRSTHDSPGACNATSGAIVSNIARIRGFYLPSSSGTIIARFASEVAAAPVTAKVGSICMYQQVG